MRLDFPGEDVLVNLAKTARAEARELDYKSEFDESRYAWEEIVRDLVAMANTRGGIIAFGFKSNGKPSGASVENVWDIDVQDVVNRVEGATGENLGDIKLVEILRDGDRKPAWIVPKSYRIIRFERDAKRFSDPVTGKKKRLAFKVEQIFFRRGPCSARATTADLDDIVRALVDEQVRALRGTPSSEVDLTRVAIEVPAVPSTAAPTATVTTDSAITATITTERVDTDKSTVNPSHVGDA